MEDTPEEVPQNVVPFRPIGDPRAPVLTPVENSAFHELARQLSARLENEGGASAASTVSEAAAGPQAAPEAPGKTA